MRYELKTKPKSPIIVEGFPGFGLVGTIATEYLIKHLDAKPIGYIRIPEIPPVIAVHQGTAIEPLGIFYSKKHNLVILHALANVTGLEWEVSELLVKMAKELSVFHYAVSLGHHRSLLYWIGTKDLMATTYLLEGEQLDAYTAMAGEGVFRISVGLEDAEDLCADLDRVLY